MYIKNKTRLNIIFQTVAAFILVICSTSCDSDFAKKDYLPDLYNRQDTLYITSNTGLIPASFEVNATNRSWKIVEYPNFIEPSLTSGVIKESSTIDLNLTIRHNEVYVNYGIYNFEIVFEVKGLGLVKFPIQYFSFGSPTISVTPEIIDLWDDAQGELSIRNEGDGLLLWQITKLPVWLSVETTSDVVEPYSDVQIKYTPQSQDLEMGKYTGEIVIQNNVGSDIHLPVNLTVNAFSSPYTYQAGELIGSKFRSKTNQVIAISKNPNRILTFTDGQSEPAITGLNRVPSSMALSEDETRLAIGFTNTEISTYDAESKTLLKTYDLDVVPDNLEFGSPNYLYYLSSASFNDDYKYLHSLNLTSGETIRSQNYEGGIKALKKIPHKNILITTKTGWSPEFLILYFHTDQGIVADKNTYWFTPHGLWPSDDGEQIITGKKVVYEVPEFNAEYAQNDLTIDGTPPIVGEFELPASNNVHASAWQSATGLLYVASGVNYYSSKTIVDLFNNSTYTKQKTYEFASYPPADHRPSNTWWEKSLGLYPFNDGSKLWLVQAFPGKDYNSPDLWGLRLLELQ